MGVIESLDVEKDFTFNGLGENPQKLERAKKR